MLSSSASWGANLINDQLNYESEGAGGDANVGFINGNTGTDDYAYDGNGT